MTHCAGAMYRVPTDIAQQFGLCELSDYEVDAVFAKMPKPA
jgi:hypothetical protein